MVATPRISVTRVETSRLNETNLENVPFGRYFTDHMLEADYENGEWKNVEIKPFQPMVMSPGNAALHYGQSIFEGIKAYRMPTDETAIFRPQDNFRRFNMSAVRMQMPTVPEDIFLEGIRQLVALDAAWIPKYADHSLYIRPVMFAADEVLGVRPSETYKFFILLSPAGPYFVQPMRIYVEEESVRSSPGGVGFAKTAGNYAASMYPAAQARQMGYDQVLWMDAIEHRYVQEIGMMNVFFIIGNTAITPDLKAGTILEGITRDSALTILGEMGYDVQERPISIEEIMETYQSGELKEVFGTGTAATVAPIKELRYKDYVMLFETDTWTAAPTLKERLNAIRYGQATDTHGWLVKV
jgi:branched-chain amino acid aminotransferase